MRHIFSVVFPLLVWQTADRAQDVGEPKAAVELFMSQYPSVVGRGLAVYSQMRGSITIRHYASDDTSKGVDPVKPLGPGRIPDDRDVQKMRLTGLDRVDFAVSGELMKRILRRSANQPSLGDSGRPSEPSPDDIVCVGQDSAFALSRKADGSPAVLKDFGRDKQGFKGRVRGSVGTWLDCFVRPFGVNPAKFFPNPDFVVKQVLPEQNFGRNMYRVDFSINYAPPEIERIKSSNAARYGWFVVSPDEGWVIREAMITTGRGATFRYRTEVGDKKDGVALPRRLTFVNPDFGCRVMDFNSVESVPSPDRDFTLASFGLPEVSITPQPVGSNRTPLILIGIGVLGLMAAIWMRVRSNRAGLS